MKNTIEQQNLQYENVAEFLKNICLIDVCVQHSRTINYSTVRSLPWKLGWIPWEILLHWICPAGISFIKHDLLQYAVKSICQHENMKSNAGSSGWKVFLGEKSICWKFQMLAKLPADHNKADSSGHQTVFLFVLLNVGIWRTLQFFAHCTNSFGTLCKNLAFLCWQYVGIWKSAHCAFTPFVHSCCLPVYSLVGFKCQYIPCFNTSHLYPNASEKQWED